MELVQFERAKVELAKATKLDEVKAIRDKAEALRMYCRQTKEGLVMQNQCAELVLRAERRAGELLAIATKDKGGHPQRAIAKTTGSIAGPVMPPKLADLGIGKTDSHRWQRIAAIPEPVFEATVKDAKAQQTELTTAGMLRVGKSMDKNARKAAHDAAPNATATAKTLDELMASGQKFGTIYADPPWAYGNQATRASTDNHYRTMPLADICALPIGAMAADKSHLHLWTTNGFLRDAFAVLDAWGFAYKSCFVWVKPEMGIGNYWRVSHEFLLLGVRGDLTFADRGLKSWIEDSRREHSAKPEIVRDLIQKASPGPRLELFARKAIAGWTCWGNEVANTLFAGDDNGT